MQPEEVARHQRARLYGGMIEAVSQGGYDATTVAHVIALAGVSRRAFYEQFPNKEQCFLATYDILVARGRKRLLEAWRGQSTWADSLHRACQTLIDDVAFAPKGPRLVLVHSLGGPRALERLQLSGLAFERLLACGFRGAPDGAELPVLAPRAIVGGIRHLAFRRLLEGRERELQPLSEELLDWIECYRSPATARLVALGLPRTQQVKPRTAALLTGEDAQARALRALARLTLKEGPARLSDVRIAELAGLSTEAFHTRFRDGRECFLALLDGFAAETLEQARELSRTAASWPQAVHLAIGAFVEHLRAHPELARIAFVELFALGPAIAEHLTASVDGLVDLVSEGAPAPRHAPAVLQEALTGALWSAMAGHVASGRLVRLPRLLDQLTFVVLAPHLGAKRAVEAIQAIRRPRRAV